MQVQTENKAAAILDGVREAYGFVPNVIRELTEQNPAVGQVYVQANAVLGRDGVLTGREQQAVILAISSYNDCHYCTKAHAKAGRAAGLSRDEVETIVAGGLPDDERLRTLVRATREVAGKRGWLRPDDLERLDASGVDRGQLYEIIALVAVKTISNYVNHLNETEVDEAFQ